MKKKIGIAALVLALAAFVTGLYFHFLAPKAQTGAKSVTVQVIVKNKNLNKSFTYKTNRKYLYELLEDEKKELRPETKKSTYGEFVNCMLGIKADETKEYYNIKVDGKDASVGISKLPLANGKTYTFTLTPL